MPYSVQSEGVIVQPDVMVTIVLFGCWLLVYVMEQLKESTKEKVYPGRRL